MIQKVTLYSLAVVLFFLVLTALMPSPVDAAEEPSVAEWLDDEETNSKRVDGAEPAGKTAENNKPGTNGELNKTNERSPMLLIIQLIFYTIIIIVMIYGLIKFLALRQKNLQPNRAISLIGGTPLGNNKSLQLVKVGGKVYLIGVADQITLIKEFSNEDEISTFENDGERQPVLFSNPLFGFLKKQTSPGQNGKFRQLFHQSLNKQKEKQNQLERDLFDDDNESRDTR